jgi:cold shock CspA family protein
MTRPLQITFKNMHSFPEVEEWIREEVFKLETFYNRITTCRVTVETPHRHHKKGLRYHVRIDIRLPGGELVVKREPTLGARLRQLGEAEVTKHSEADATSKDLRFAIQHAFKAAARRVEDFARRQSGRVKAHASPLEGVVTRLDPEKGFGFLVTPEGREVYFHRNSVLNQGFGRLEMGTRVAFAEEPGDEGPQASTVRIRARSRAPVANFAAI